VVVWYVGCVPYYIIPYILPSSTLPWSHAAEHLHHVSVVCTKYYQWAYYIIPCSYAC
jgi:hypothetical protein